MATSPQFAVTPNNVIKEYITTTSTNLTWEAGANGGIIKAILARVVADVDVVIGIKLSIGGVSSRIVCVQPAAIATADEDTSTTPPVNLLDELTFPGLAAVDENRYLVFGAGDGIEIEVLSSWTSGSATVAIFGGDY